MSLLMQALRKAERARVQNGHEPDDAEPAPPSMEGGPAFSVMPDAWRLEPLDAAPPVMAAQEAVHDPVPPQARHEARRVRQPDREPAVPSASYGVRHEGGNSMEGGLPRGRAREAAVRTGEHSPVPPRAIASSQRRLMALVALLLGLMLVFGFVYWRAVYGPGPGARLPMVPMPAAGLPQAASGGMQSGAGIAVTPYVAPNVVPSAHGGADGAADEGAYLPGTAPAPASSGAGAGAGAFAGSASAAPATRPNVEVTIPTQEQLAAIPDPAIRAEAMRDAAERAARQVRHDTSLAAPGPIDTPQASPALSAATVSGPPAASGRNAATASPRQSGSAKARAKPAVVDGPTSSRTLQTAVGPSGDVRFVRGAAPSGIAPAVQNGYNALKTGDLATARQQYDLALLQDPNNRDALLGAAALAQREGDGRQASSNYLRLLELDPSDPDALAGLSELRSGDLEANEIKLKGVARKHPDSGPVQFALGNLFARQGRWPEAQQSYFRAYSAMPDNADYAYNLGVGLDRMNQPRLAQTYYRRALELAQASPPAFNVETVRKRLQALESPPE